MEQHSERWPTAAERRDRLVGCGFDLRKITPCAPSRRAPALVLIDGAPYAAFGCPADAYMAVQAWQERWPAVEGRHLEVVVRARAN